MSSNVDNRIVSMQFDNRQFESGVQTTMSTLEKLKEKLNFKNAGEGLQGLTSAANKVDFGGLSINIDGISAKFSAFQSFVHGMFESLGADVMNFGKRLVSSLTFDQISSGWNKYGEMATSVASIIAATGQTQEETYEQLDKLNWFSDATSYSLTQMTGAYSKFAAAGVDAEESMQAIMGLATASSRAGISASDSRFNNVLYNVAQAMGTGYMGTMDWKSLELAGIATQEFKQKIIDVGVELGTLREEEGKVFFGDMEITAEGLRDTLSEKWVDKKIMLAAFGAYGGFVDEVYDYATKHGVTAEEAMQALADTTDQFGYAAMRSAQETKTWAEAVDATKDAVSTLWMKIFEDVIGNYEEAKEVWGSVAGFLYDSFAGPLEKVESILSIWKGFGGRNYLIEGLGNAFSAFESIIDAVKDAFDGLLPSISGFSLANVTRHFRDFTKTLTPSEETLDKITRAFRGLSSIVDLGKTIFSKIFGVVKGFFKSMSGGTRSILDVAAALGDWVTATVDAIKNSEVFNEIFEKVGDVVNRVGEFLRSVLGNIWVSFAEEGGGVPGVINAIIQTLEDFSEMILTIIQDLTGWDLSGWFEGLDTVFGFLHDKLIALIELLTGEKDFSVWETIKKIFTDIGDVIGPIVEKVGGFFGKIVTGVKNFVASIDLSKVTDALSSVWEWVKKAGTKIWEFIKNLAGSLKDLDFVDFTNILGGVAVGGAGVGIWQLADKIKEFVESLTKAKEQTESKGGIKEFLDGIKTAFTDFSDALKKSINVNMILKLATATIMLSYAMKMISEIPQEKMVSSLGGVTVLLGELVTALYGLTKMDLAGNLKPAATAMLLMSFSITILAGAAKKLAELDWNQLAVGLAGVGGLLLEVGLFVNNIDEKNLMATGFGLIEVALAISVLSSSAEKFSKWTPDQALAGLGSVGILLMELAMFVNAVDPKKIASTGFGLIEVSAALMILSNVAEKFANWTPEQLLAGLGAVGVLLGELAAFTQFVDPKGLIGAGLGMIEIAAALAILAGVTERFAALDPERLVTALGGIGVVLAEIGLFAYLIDEFAGGAGKLVALGAGLILLGSGLAIVGAVVKSLSSIPMDDLVKGVAALGAILLELGVALKLAEGSILGAASLLILSVALGLLIPPLMLLTALSWEAIAKGLTMLGGALLILLGAGAAAMLVGPGLLILAGALAALGISLVAAGAGIAALSAGIAAFGLLSTGAIEAFILGMEAIIISILTLLPNIATALAASIVVFISTIASGSATILKAVVALGGAILDALIELVPKVVELVITTLSQILAGLIELVPQILELIGEILLGILDLLIEAVPKVIEIIFAAINTIIEGLTEFIPKVVQMFVTLVESLIAAVVELIPAVVEGFMQLVTGIYNAIAENLPGLIQSGVDIVVAFMEGIGSAVPQLVDAGFKMIIDFINGLADAISGNTETLLDAIDNLIWAVIDAGVAVITHGVDNFLTAGKSLMDSGLVKGIKDKWEAVKTAVKTAITAAKNKITEKVTEWLSAGKTLIDNIISGVKEKVSSLKDSVKTLIDNAKQAIADKVSEWVQMGKNLIQGLINGILGKKSALNDAVADTAGSATDTTARVWKEKSPSKVGEDQGEFYVLGLINGVENKSNGLISSTEEMAQGAIDAMSTLLGRDFEFSDDLDPVITPILDLTELQNGMTEMDSMFGERQLSSDLSVDNANLMTTRPMNPSQQAIDMLQSAINKLSGMDQGQTINNTFNVQTNDPYEFATRVSEIIQSQIERSNAVWA